MKHFRLLLATLLAVVCSTGAWAQVTTVSGVTYTIVSGKAYVHSISSSTDGNIAFPEMIFYTDPSSGVQMPYQVAGFYSSTSTSNLNQDKWKTLYLPAFFSELNGKLEGGMVNLETVQFAQNNLLTSLPTSAFSNCTKLKSVILSNTIQSLGEKCFYGCSSLTSVSSPNNNASLTSIGRNAFYNCSSLQTVNFPNVQMVAEMAFYRCTSLVSASFPLATELEANSFYGCTSLRTVTIPEVEIISDYVFTDCEQLQQISVPNATEIGKTAFRGCSSLQSADLSGCVYIRSNAFFNCPSLSSVQLGSSLTQIEDNAFYMCSGLTSITLPNRLNYIGDYAFYRTNIKTIEIPMGIVPVDSNFYPGASGVTVKVSAGNASVYKQLPGWSSSAFTFVEEGQKRIHIRTGASNKVVEVWSNGVKMITISEAGSGYSQAVNMPTNLELRIPMQYFVKININGSNQPSYYTVSDPTDEIYSGYKFYNLPDLTYVSDIDVFFNYVPESGIHFADAKVEEICLANWDTNGDGVLSFAEAAAVTTLRKDNGDGTYGQSVFSSEPNITSFDELKYFTGLTSIDQESFSSSINLTSVIVPENVETIARRAFHSCSQLKNIRLPENLKTIGDLAFYGCTALESVLIPKNVQTIGTEAFLGLNLTSIAVSEANPYFDSRGGCNAIIETDNNKLLVGCKNTRIPEDVTSIGYSAFRAGDITSVELPAGLTSIDDYAFYWCGNLNTIIAKMDAPATYASHTFFDVNRTYKLYVPAGKRDAYIAAGWDENVFKGGVVEVQKTNDGDVNCDGQVTIADVTKLVNIILGKE